MLPARKARRPASLRILWRSVVVVDLPFVPVIPMIRAFQEAVGELDLGQDRDAAARGRPRTREAGDAGAGDDQVGGEEGGRRRGRRFRGRRRAPVQAAAAGPSSAAVFFSLIVTRAPAAEQEVRRRLARPAEADDQNVLVREVHAHLNFRVARLNRAKMIPRIQNRTTTFSSGQPRSSKWWWSGAIRKIALALAQLEVADLEEDRERLEDEDAGRRRRGGIPA